MSASVYLELLALSQCLPGPTSTQVSFALGVVQKGVLGGLLTGIGRMHCPCALSGCTAPVHCQKLEVSVEGMLRARLLGS